MSGHRKEQRRDLECTLPSSYLQIWRERPERRATKEGPLVVFILQLPRAQLSARIRDDRDKSNFVSAVQARKSAPIFPLEILLSPSPSPPPLAPTSFSREDSRGANRDVERGMKDETTGRSSVSLSLSLWVRAPPRNSRILSIRHESLFGRPR